jgi:hypothetical protein
MRRQFTRPCCLLVVVLASGCGGNGPKTPRDALIEHANAVAAFDEPRVLAVCHATPEQQDAIRAHLQNIKALADYKTAFVDRFGEPMWNRHSPIKLTLGDDVIANAKTVEIKESDDEAFCLLGVGAETTRLVKVNGRWYIDLGSAAALGKVKDLKKLSGELREGAAIYNKHRERIVAGSNPEDLIKDLMREMSQ